jgi:hypothetical protein
MLSAVSSNKSETIKNTQTAGSDMSLTDKASIQNETKTEQIKASEYKLVKETKQQTQLKPETVNINKVVNVDVVRLPENADAIIINYDKETKKFTFYDRSRSLIGFFTIIQLIKYIGNTVSNQFMSYVSPSNLLENLINAYLFKKDDGKLIWHNHLTSPFMGDIEMLIKLNTDMSEFINKSLDQELIKIESKSERNKINDTIKKIYYDLLNHTLHIIASSSDDLRNDEDKKAIRDKLLKYSVGIMYKITTFTKLQLETYTNKQKELIDNMSRVTDLKKSLTNQITTLEEEIRKQNEKIKLVSDKLTICMNEQLQQGGYTPSSSNTSSKTSSNSKEPKIKEKVVSITSGSETETTSDSNSESNSESESESTSSKEDKQDFSITEFLNKSEEDTDNGFDTHNTDSSEEDKKVKGLTTELESTEDKSEIISE